MKIYDDYNGVYTSVASPEFIKRRDKFIGDGDDYYRKDAEFPEWHISEHLPHVSLNESWQWDTDDDKFPRNDLKQNSKNGVHISYPVEKNIRRGIVKYLTIWEWHPNNRHRKVVLGESYTWEILGIVDAKEALNRMNPITRRFTFNCVQAA